MPSIFGGAKGSSSILLFCVRIALVTRDDTPTNPWQNPENPLDVNDDGAVTLLDIMLVLDDIDAGGMRLLPDPLVSPNMPNPTPGPPGTARYLDVNGDGGVSLLDAQRIADVLNAASPLMASPAHAVNESPTSPDHAEATQGVQQDLDLHRIPVIVFLFLSIFSHSVETS